MARIPSTRLPIIITERVYARAVLAATEEGLSLAQYTEAALAEAVKRTEKASREAEYQAACEAARASRGIAPTRWEYFGERAEPYRPPFVRPAPEASGRNPPGRPSSRQHQNGTAAQPGSKAPKAAPQRPAAWQGAQRPKARTREEPPFDAGENRGMPGFDRWGPEPDYQDQAPTSAKHTPAPQN